MKNKIDLTIGTITKKILIVAIPALLLSLVNTAYNLVDMYFIGRVSEINLDATSAIAGVGTAGLFIWLFQGFIFFGRIGTEIFVSQNAGKNDAEGVAKSGVNGLMLSLILGVLFSIMMYFCLDIFIDLFKLENTPAMFAKDYLRIWVFIFPIAFLIQTKSCIFNGLGMSIITFAITASGLILNVILDPIFIINLELGIKGAAYATLISQSIVLIAFIILFLSSYRPFKISFKLLDKKIMKNILKKGYIVALQSMIFTFIGMVISFQVVKFGTETVAAQRIGSQIEAFSWMVAGGFSIALTAFIGQNYGAKQFNRMKEGYDKVLIIVVIYSLILSVAFFIFSEELIKLFISNEETVKIGSSYMKILSVSQLFMVVEIATSGAFYGVGKPTLPALTSVIFNIARAVAVVIAVSSGVENSDVIWWIVTISTVFKGTITFTGYLIKRNKLEKSEGGLNYAK